MSQVDGPEPTQGFGHSKRRIAAEISILVGGVLLVALVLWWLASGLSDWVAERLPPSADRAIGEQAFEQAAPSQRRCSNPRAVAYVERIARPLIEAAGSPFHFEFVVLNDEQVNAFALPGGFVAVNLGLLEQARSGDEVAGVLAHELSHVTLRHGTRRVVRQAGTGVLLSLLLGGTDFQSLGYAAGALVDTAYDRDQEAEADAEGERLLEAAGISPLAMSEFFARLAAQGPSLPALLSTHPDPGDRAERAAKAAQGFVATRTLPPPPTGLECNE